MDPVGRDIVVASISTLGLLLVTIVPLVWADMRARRRTHETLDRLHHKADTLIEVTNSVHDEEQVDGDGMTLGRMLRQVDEKVDAGFARNDETHALLQDLLIEHGRRLNVHRAEIDELKRRDV